MKKLIALFILGFLLSGCVGVIALSPESTTYKAPFAPDTSYQDSAGKLRSTKTSTQEAFLREWGEPSHKEIGADSESWTYNRRREWCGVVLGLGIPIPLVLPVCSGEDRIVFRGDSVVSITVLRPTDRGIMCGLFVNGFTVDPTSVPNDAQPDTLYAAPVSVTLDGH